MEAYLSGLLDNELGCNRPLVKWSIFIKLNQKMEVSRKAEIVRAERERAEQMAASIRDAAASADDWAVAAAKTQVAEARVHWLGLQDQLLSIYVFNILLWSVTVHLHAKLLASTCLNTIFWNRLISLKM